MPLDMRKEVIHALVKGREETVEYLFYCVDKTCTHNVFFPTLNAAVSVLVDVRSGLTVVTWMT